MMLSNVEEKFSLFLSTFLFEVSVVKCAFIYYSCYLKKNCFAKNY